MRPSLLVVVLGGLASGAAAEQLPPGPGRVLVLEGCVQCHDLRPILSQKKSAQAWRHTVNEMVWRGAPLFAGEAQLVAEYLGEFFGPAARPAAPAPASGSPAPEKSLPSGAGRELLLSACGSCHGLETTLAARKSEAEWRRSVEVMSALGARLNGSEQETLARYLFRALGDKQ